MAEAQPYTYYTYDVVYMLQLQGNRRRVIIVTYPIIVLLSLPFQRAFRPMHLPDSCGGQLPTACSSYRIRTMGGRWTAAGVPWGGPQEERKELFPETSDDKFQRPQDDGACTDPHHGTPTAVHLQPPASYYVHE